MKEEEPWGKPCLACWGSPESLFGFQTRDKILFWLTKCSHGALIVGRLRHLDWLGIVVWRFLVCNVVSHCCAQSFRLPVLFDVWTVWIWVLCCTGVAGVFVWFLWKDLSWGFQGCKNERRGGDTVHEVDGGPYLTYVVYKSYRYPSMQVRSPGIMNAWRPQVFSLWRSVYISMGWISARVA